MRSLRPTPAALLLLPLLSVGSARADVISLYLGDLYDYGGTGISADGKVAVGSGFDEDASPFRHTAAGTEIVTGGAGEDRIAGGTSGDGSVTVGSSTFDAWKSIDGAFGQSLPMLPGGEGEQFPYAWDVSSDGSIVVGATPYGPTAAKQAVRWTDAGVEPLGFLDGDVYSVAQAISADGSVIAGTSGFGRAVAWLSGAPPVALGDLAGGGTRSEARGVSADGSTIVGHGSSAAAAVEAFRWTQTSGMVGLGFLPGTSTSSAEDASADGSWIVGSSGVGSSGGAFIWHATFGMRSLHDFLVEDWGFFLEDGWIFYSANAISDDGMAIVGTAFDPGLQRVVGFLATVPEPATALMLAAALAALGSRRLRAI